MYYSSNGLLNALNDSIADGILLMSEKDWKGGNGLMMMMIRGEERRGTGRREGRRVKVRA